MIELLSAHAQRRGLEVVYVSRVSFGVDAPAGKLGGWDAQRRQIQVLSSLSRQEKAFVLAHELVHAELAWEQQDSGLIRDEGEMEMVVHCATEGWLAELGLSGYREFCVGRERDYPQQSELRQQRPELAALSENLAAGLAFALTEELEASL